MRKDHEFPKAIVEWGWRFHHTGIPTKEQKPGERFIQHLKFYVSGFPDSPFGVEWMRFEADCPLPALVQNIPHLAFVVDDLDFELKKRGFKVLVPPNPPSKGVRVAMIEHNGAPVELMEFTG